MECRQKKDRTSTHCQRGRQVVRGRQADRIGQANRQEGRKKQTAGQTDKLAGGQTNRQEGRQIDRKAD